eukprot:c3541_g1_i1.p1 GENE.c3541_g1_i1~~c3541_g1_i1.p1  ORF type:complete len:239 (+),score=53.25 c3541_g1_i1:52-717(+)
MDALPNQTIYIRGLNEKIHKDELKKSLHAVFSQFGTIIDVVALKTLKMRGQAFVVFETVQAATQALTQMQGFPFYNKPMVIQFAKGKSDAVAKLDGSFVPRERQLSAKRRKELEEAGRKKKKEKKQEGEAPRPKRPMPNFPEQIVPTNVLFLENLPPQCNEMMLSMLFNQFPGYSEARLAPSKPGIAFVEFESEPQATVAMNGLQGFKITDEHFMKISYRK